MLKFWLNWQKKEEALRWVIYSLIIFVIWISYLIIGILLAPNTESLYSRLFVPISCITLFVCYKAVYMQPIKH